MHYYHDIEVRYQDTDDNKKLRLNMLEQYLLEVAGTVADSLGFGTNMLHPRGMGWILTHLSVEMQTLPTCKDHLRFETWIESNAHRLSTRVFRIYRMDGEQLVQIGQAKSVWAVLDLNKREIVDIFAEPIFNDAVDGEVLPMDRMPRMRLMPEVDKECAGVVYYSDLDYNGHCNSCHYLMKMLDIHRPDLSGAIRLDLIYSKEVYADETIRVACKQQADGMQYQILTESGELSCACYLKNV